MIIAYVIATVAGIAATTQASVNTEGRRMLKSPYLSAAFNFVVSFIVLAVIVLLTQHNLYIPLAEVAKHPLWIWIGGCCGPVVIIMSVLCLPVLGSAKNMMVACTGQILAGLIIDQFALFGSMQISMTVMRTIGAVLVMAGIVLASLEKEERSERNNHGRVWIYILLALFNGTAAAVQIAANGTLNTVVQDAGKTTIISMSVAFITVCTVMIILMLIKGPDAIFEDGGSFSQLRPNMMVVYGGCCAVVVVGGNAIAAGMLSTGLINILNLAGMMATSLLIDAVGFLGIPKKAVTLKKVAGMLLIIAGAAIISLL